MNNTEISEAVKINEFILIIILYRAIICRECILAGGKPVFLLLEQLQLMDLIITELLAPKKSCCISVVVQSENLLLGHSVACVVEIGP